MCTSPGPDLAVEVATDFKYCFECLASDVRYRKRHGEEDDRIIHVRADWLWLYMMFPPPLAY